MLDIVFVALFGALLGFFSGLVPGFHANNLALMALWISSNAGINGFSLSIVVVCAGVAHSISGFIPSIFLGAPSEDTALAISPGHRMLLSGRGYQALVLCVIGGVFASFAVLIGFSVLKWYALGIYEIMKSYLGVLLVLVSLMMIFIEKRKLWAFSLFFMSGVYGIVSLNSPINSNFVLLPVLSGLFGASTLILSCKSPPAIPMQATRINVPIKDITHGTLAGFLGGVLAGFLPGVGTSQSAIIAQRMTCMAGSRKFLIALGTIGVSDVLLSLFALSFIGRTRSGIAAAAETLAGTPGTNELLLFLGVGIFATGVAAIATLKAGHIFAKKSHKYNSRRISAAVLVLLSTLCYIFTGLLGVLVFFVGSAIGILPHMLGIKKSILISCLLLPTTMYFTGTDVILLKAMGFWA